MGIHHRKKMSRAIVFGFLQLSNFSPFIPKRAKYQDTMCKRQHEANTWCQGMKQRNKSENGKIK